MLLLDDVMHRYVQAQCPQLRVLSFVDNWDFLTWDATAATQQLDLLLDFAGLVDLTVDRKKTFGWSTSPAIRTSLRAQGLQVKHFAKDLGAHVASPDNAPTAPWLNDWTLLGLSGLSSRAAKPAIIASSEHCVA